MVLKIIWEENVALAKFDRKVLEGASATCDIYE